MAVVELHRVGTLETANLYSLKASTQELQLWQQQ